MNTNLIFNGKRMSFWNSLKEALLLSGGNFHCHILYTGIR
jgi:hypothetical protein